MLILSECVCSLRIELLQLTFAREVIISKGFFLYEELGYHIGHHRKIVSGIPGAVLTFSSEFKVISCQKLDKHELKYILCEESPRTSVESCPKYDRVI